MARFDDDDATIGAGLYAELLATEEGKFARRGGRRLLVDDQMVTTASPGPVLVALRVGQPVEISGWQLPRWARGGIVANRRVKIHPDGRVVEVDR
ncbi:hypothetical protein ABQF33_17365 [Mycolicibacterium sp. XJ2]